MKRLLSLCTLIFTISLITNAQSFQIMRYGIEDGLLHEKTYTMLQDANGYIWISTTQGICRLDGKNFTSNFLGDTLPTSIANVIYMDSKDRLWFGYNDGQIALFENNGFRVFSQDGVDKSAIVDFAEDSDGNILAIMQKSGLIEINNALNFKYITEPFSGIFVSRFTLTADGNLLIGSFDGLTLFLPTEEEVGYVKAGKISGIPFATVYSIAKGLEDNTYWLGTDEEGLFYLKGSGDDPSLYQVVKVGEDQGLEYSRVKSIMLDPSGYLWLADDGVGVYRFKISADAHLSERMFFGPRGGLPEIFIEDILKDDEGNVWFASSSNGIAVLRDQAFTFFSQVDGLEVPEITAISLKGTTYWFGSREGQLILSGPAGRPDVVSYSTTSGLPDETVTALWQDDKGNVYIGTESSGVYTTRKGEGRVRRYFKADNSLGNAINAIRGDDENLWLATNDGVYKISLKDGSTEHMTTRTGLPHNLIHDILIDSKDRVWIATRGSGIYCVSEDNPELDLTIAGDPKLEFVCLAEDKEGRIWAGTAEDGVIMFGKDSLKLYSVAQGLKTKYTYAIKVDPVGDIWVGHRLGLSKINPATGNIVVYDSEMGFTADVLYRSVDINDMGQVLFGTNNGLIMYDTYKARPDTVPPRLNITQLVISDSIYNTTVPVRLPFGAYKVTIDYVGINLSNPEQVTYRFKLDGYDDEWSEPTRDTRVTFTKVEDGDYTFMLSACDGNGNCTGDVAMVSFSVKIPIWKAWWFILLVFVLVIGSVYLIIKIRERNQKALQEYLETQLDQRTREVIQQKEEIEVKNRDITDSINYAQRIQASILPPIQRLHSTFSGSFVFYQPRDIVSGDFYWYDKLDEERFIIVCADSTGHGVPGAFMSMIGTTMIKDICLRSDINSPSQVLITLDQEVREALNQNQETDGSNDGMDIIVAEINLKTNVFKVSSAMRPVIVYKGDEQIYVKGSRSSVGGQLDDTAIEKEFVDEVYQLEKGDIIYMFSDGYPDQFGGPLGRKFKMVRLKNLLRDIHDKPMDEQYNYVKSNFFLWKEDLEQVDDVLFMGIKI